MANTPIEVKTVDSVAKARGEEDRSLWEFVTIPDADIFDQPLAPIWVNHDRFEAGKTYHVCPTLAGELRRILDTARRADVRLLRPDRDRRAEQEATGRGEHARGAELW